MIKRFLPCLVLAAASMLVQSCRDSSLSPSAAPSSPADSAATNTPYGERQHVATAFTLLGGYRLQVDFAGEGLALITDASGHVVQAIAGANTQLNSLNLYTLNVEPGTGGNTAQYPILDPTRTWRTRDLFPRMMSNQNIRDVTAVRSNGAYELAGIGRVYYNTSPRDFTQLNVRVLNGESASLGASLGPSREIAVDLPEQEFSGFIKHQNASADLREIGGGAYDSGQGSVGGLSFAVQQPNGRWMRVLAPPAFGDLESLRLPRDTAYSCPDGTSWVCIPPANGAGVWSTERIGGGGVQYGDNLLFIATLGYGARTYARQSYTFGEGTLDRAVAYFFKRNAATGVTTFNNFDRWMFAEPGELVVGVALGRMHGNPNLILFVVKSMAWNTGLYRSGSVLQLFQINSAPTQQ